MMDTSAPTKYYPQYGWFLFIWVTIALAACSSQDGTDTQEAETLPEESQAFFVADPQPVGKQDVPVMETGAKLPSFRLPGVDGKFHTDEDYADSEVLVVIFTCNHCPTAQAYEDRMVDFANDYAEKGVQVIAISPNSPLSLLHEECGYTDLHDSFEEMIIRAEDKAFPFPYLYDGDTHETSLKFGPVATPHVFVFGQDRTLKYNGRMDASEKPGTANSEDLRAAVDALLDGQPVPQSETKSFGCSVKWAWKDEWKQKIEADWAAAPVSLEPIDEAGIRDLMANDSEKLRLVNLWATWCGPCVIEYPSFIEIHRMYKDRPFEFISISADRPEQQAAALAFLEKQNSALRNYIFEKDDKYALIEAIDPEWNGALPYTALIAPGGEIIAKVEGSIDPLEIKKAIVGHPLIGRYY